MTDSTSSNYFAKRVVPVDLADCGLTIEEIAAEIERRRVQLPGPEMHSSNFVPEVPHGRITELLEMLNAPLSAEE